MTVTKEGMQSAKAIFNHTAASLRGLKRQLRDPGAQPPPYMLHSLVSAHKANATLYCAMRAEARGRQHFAHGNPEKQRTWIADQCERKSGAMMRDAFAGNAPDAVVLP